MTVLRTYARVWSADLEASLDMFETIFGHSAQFQFDFGDVRIALLDNIQITAGPESVLDGFRSVTATIVVDDLDATLAMTTKAAGKVSLGPKQGPVARFALVQGVDGTQVEYSEWTDPRLIASVLPASVE